MPSSTKPREASYRPRLKKLSKAELVDLERRNALVIEHLDWAYGIARAALRGLPTWFTLDDLTGPAEIGLIQAAERYDAATGVPFRAYAQQRVYGACISSIRRREYRERAHESLDVVVEQHEQSVLREESASDGKARTARPVIPSLRDVQPTPEEAIQATRGGIFESTWRLPARHRRVILLHYQQSVSLEEIAGRIGVGASRVSQLHREALVMLRPAAEEIR